MSAQVPPHAAQPQSVPLTGSEGRVDLKIVHAVYRPLDDERLRWIGSHVGKLESRAAGAGVLTVVGIVSSKD